MTYVLAVYGVRSARLLDWHVATASLLCVFRFDCNRCSGAWCD